jgi:Flp pilus assembly protein TadG
MLRRFIGSERGTAVVEFALVAPILFLLVIGILDFGRALNYYNDLTQLAGQGARAASVGLNPDNSAIGQSANTVDNTDCGNLNTSIQCQLACFYTTTTELKSQNGGIQVSIPSKAAQVGDPVTVHATYQFNFTGSIFGFTTITLSATQTQRAEVIPTQNYAGTYSGTTCQ